MKVTVQLFAALRELVGQRQLELDLAEGATIDDLRARLSADYPKVAPFLPTMVAAINEDYVPDSRALRDGDRVALIPPVSGGAVETAAHFLVTEQALDPRALVELVRRDESGAVALFYGVVRNHNEGRRVIALEYEAYPEMAVRKMREVAAEVRARWPIDDIAIHHRVGRLAVGETSLVVAVSSAHRQQAFEACHHAVDRIKQVVPIWKKEIWEDGGAWLPGQRPDVGGASQ